MASVADKRQKLQTNWQGMTAELGPYQPTVQKALLEIRTERIMQRIWDHDHTVWKPKPDEISNRLGWLHSVEMMQANCVRLQALTQSVLTNGYTNVLLLGMGGSSLAPEVFAKTFGGAGLTLSVLDNTDPGRVLAFDAQALLEANRRVIRFDLEGDVNGRLANLL